MNSETKQDVIASIRLHDTDSGSAQSQVARLTVEINGLMGHFKKHIHDYSGKRGLLKKVTRRRRFLDYIKKRDFASYKQIIEKLNLRK